MAIIHSVTQRAEEERLTRECPKCHKKQKALASQLKTSITCKVCGAEIPPRTR